MPRTMLAKRSQSGSMILEALIAILIFSIGVLGLIGMQTRAVMASSDAQYRVQATLLANELIGKMWASDRTPATLQAQFASSPAGAAYTAWAWQGYDTNHPGSNTISGAATGSVLNALPMAGGTALLPVVTVSPVSTVTSASGTVVNSLVSITISWQTSKDGSVHNYVTTAQIGG